MGDSNYSSCESCSDDDIFADSPDSHPSYCQPSPNPTYSNVGNGERPDFDLFDCAPPVQVQIPFTISIDIPVSPTLPPSNFPTKHQDSDADAYFSSHHSHDNCSLTDDDSREEDIQDFDEFNNSSANDDEFSTPSDNEQILVNEDSHLYNALTYLCEHQISTDHKSNATKHSVIDDDNTNSPSIDKHISTGSSVLRVEKKFQ